MTTKTVEFQSRRGEQVTGQLAEPAGADKAPAVVLIQEWWGVNDHIKSLVQRMAGEGFVVLAPDLFHGKTTRDGGEAGQLMAALDFARAVEEIAGAQAYLRAHPRCNGKVGVMGFCMGGALSFAAAAHVPEFDAVVPFYGVPDATKVDYGKVRAPIMAHFARRDGWAKPELAEAIKAKLEARGQTMELHLYDADHAFVNDTRPEVYNAEAATLAWKRTVEFFKAQLT